MSAESLRPGPLLLAMLLLSGVGGMLIWAILSLDPHALGLSMQVREMLPQSGVRAEVTAVLLNFRGYDTLLELAVLLTALIGVWQLGPLELPQATTPQGPVLESLLRLLTPVIILVSGYVLWLGGHSAGGAFQAGALLAGAGVMMLVAQQDLVPLREHVWLRLILVLGPAVFVLVAGGVMLAGGLMLEYPRSQAGSLILLIEAASTLSIGCTLALLFAGGRPVRGLGR